MRTTGYYHSENPAGLEYLELYEVIDDVTHVPLHKKILDHIAPINATSNMNTGISTINTTLGASGRFLV